MDPSYRQAMFSLSSCDYKNEVSVTHNSKQERAKTAGRYTAGEVLYRVVAGDKILWTRQAFSASRESHSKSAHFLYPFYSFSIARLIYSTMSSPIAHPYNTEWLTLQKARIQALRDDAGLSYRQIETATAQLYTSLGPSNGEKSPLE